MRSELLTWCLVSQVSLDWECGYVESSGLERSGVVAVFKSVIPFSIPCAISCYKITPPSPQNVLPTAFYDIYAQILKYFLISNLCCLQTARELQTQALLRGTTPAPVSFLIHYFEHNLL